MILTATSLAASSQHFDIIPRYCSAALATCSALVEKIRHVVYPYMTATTGIYHCGYGSKELKNGITLQPSSEQATRIDKTSKEVLAPSSTYLKVHGLLVGATGFCSILEALNSFGAINYGKITNAICTAGNIFFIYANVAALEENIRVYEEIKKIEPKSGEPYPRELFWRKHSAVWGVLGNLGYILASSLLLFGAPAALALVIGIVSSMCGALKLLCDFIVWSQERAGT